MHDDRDPYVVGRGYGLARLCPSTKGPATKGPAPVCPAMKRPASAGQGRGRRRHAVLQRSHPHLRLRRPPMRTIKRRRQLVVAELVGAVAVGEVVVGVGGVDAHD